MGTPKFFLQALNDLECLFQFTVITIVLFFYGESSEGKNADEVGNILKSLAILYSIELLIPTGIFTTII